MYLCTAYFYGDPEDLTVTGLAAALSVMQQHLTHGNNFRYAFFIQEDLAFFVCFVIIWFDSEIPR